MLSYLSTDLLHLRLFMLLIAYSRLRQATVHATILVAYLLSFGGNAVLALLRFAVCCVIHLLDSYELIRMVRICVVNNARIWNEIHSVSICGKSLCHAGYAQT